MNIFYYFLFVNINEKLHYLSIGAICIKPKALQDILYLSLYNGHLSGNIFILTCAFPLGGINVSSGQIF